MAQDYAGASAIAEAEGQAGLEFLGHGSLARVSRAGNDCGEQGCCLAELIERYGRDDVWRCSDRALDEQIDGGLDRKARLGPIGNLLRRSGRDD
jgi:hypothetical protein